MVSPPCTEVVVTGVGVICGWMDSADELFHQLARGSSIVRLHPRLQISGIPNPACAHVDDGLWRRLGAQSHSLEWPLGPQAQLALHAAQQAMRHSGLDKHALPLGRSAVFVGANKYTCDADDLAAMARSYDLTGHRLLLDELIEHHRLFRGKYLAKRQDSAAAAVAGLCSGRAQAMTFGDACAAGGIAIGTAFRQIRHGAIDVAIAGATEAMCDFVPMIGFGMLGALCTDAGDPPHTWSRPFDRQRRGFVMGEGSAFLVLESERHARQRGALPMARVTGFAKQAEAWRMTSSPEGGGEYARCIRAALSDAGLEPHEVDHINAHGTSTALNDACEAAAIRAVYGDRAREIPLSANKSALGHSLAASGAIEAVLSVLSLVRQCVLPTLNFQEADEGTVGLNVVTQAQDARLRHVVSHLFGFGGENCALVFSR